MSMNANQTSGSSLLEEIDAPLGLAEYEPQSYFAIWQRPEARFTHFGVGYPSSGASFVLICPSEVAAQMYIDIDAADNNRTAYDYEARRLSLPEAFEEARNQPVPIVHSTGLTYNRVGGVAVFDIIASRFRIIDLLPL